MPTAIPRRVGAAAMMVAASVTLSGCWLTAGTYQEKSKASSPSPSPSATQPAREEPVRVPNTVLLPALVAPPVVVPWKPYSDQRTQIRFNLPHRPIRHKDDYVTSYGGHIISMDYTTQFRVEDDRPPVTIVVNPYTVTGAVYTSGQTFFQSMEKSLKDSGSRNVTLSKVHSGTVKSRPAVFGTLEFLTHDKKKRTYRQMVLITGSSWRLFVAVYIDDRTITPQDRRDANSVLDQVLNGLRMAAPKT